MTDTVLLQKKIDDSGLKAKAIASRLGISRTSWYYRRKGITPFKADEIQKLCEMLNIKSLREKEKIFFAKM